MRMFESELRKTLRRGSACGALIAASLFFSACSAGSDNEAAAPVGYVETATASSLQSLCASEDEAERVREFYSETRPGAVLPIPGRKLNLLESKIVSGLPVAYAVGVEGSPDRLAEIWRSIDAWGADTNVRLVLSIDGWHPFDFPSKTPVTQEKHSQGFYDVYAEGDDGVHIHLKPDDVKLIYAAQLPDADASLTRSINLYDSDGRLIIGVYASKAGSSDFDAAAVTGFDGTWNLIENMPRACAQNSVEG